MHTVTLNIYLSLSQGTFAFALIKYSPLKYNNEYVYPWWGHGIGWLLALSSMLCIPVWIALKLYSTPGTLREVSLAFRCKGLTGSAFVISEE